MPLLNTKEYLLFAGFINTVNCVDNKEKKKTNTFWIPSLHCYILFYLFNKMSSSFSQSYTIYRKNKNMNIL